MRAASSHGYGWFPVVVEEVAMHIPRLMRAKSEAELRRLERGAKRGAYVAPIHGMFANAEEWSKLSSAEQCRRVVATLSDVHTDWLFCLFSAAAVHGLEVSRDDVRIVHRRVSGRTRISDNGKMVSHHGNRTAECVIDGVRVTPALETVVDCLCELDFSRALAIADSAMRVLHLSKDEMIKELASRGECKGWRIARDAIRYADPLSANGGESVARAVMIEQGFMIPRLQVERHDPLNPEAVYYVDYLWDLGDSGIVIGELDGKDKYVKPEMTGGRDALAVLRDERQRESRITATGGRVFRFRYGDVMNTEWFIRALEVYGIPRGPARAIGK